MRPPNITRILSGEYNPSIDAVARILAAIDRTWADLDPSEAKP